MKYLNNYYKELIMCEIMKAFEQFVGAKLLSKKNVVLIRQLCER